MYEVLKFLGMCTSLLCAYYCLWFWHPDPKAWPGTVLGIPNTDVVALIDFAVLALIAEPWTEWTLPRCFKWLKWLKWPHNDVEK